MAKYVVRPVHPVIQQLGEHQRMRGPTQREIGERCGMPVSQVSNILRGTNSPTLYVLGRLAAAMDFKLVLAPLSGEVAGDATDGQEAR